MKLKRIKVLKTGIYKYQFFHKNNSAETIIGHVWIKPKGKDLVYIYYFSILERFQGKKLATILAKKVFGLLFRDYKMIELDVDMRNEAAYNLWKRQGFRIVHEGQEFVKMIKVYG